jgi:hypothetical protein
MINLGVTSQARFSTMLKYQMIHNAKDLSPDQKVAIESLLGRRIVDDEAISVCAIRPPAVPDDQKKEAVAQLEQYFSKVDARRQPISSEEAEDIIDEAMKSVRPSYRPHR